MSSKKSVAQFFLYYIIRYQSRLNLLYLWSPSSSDRRPWACQPALHGRLHRFLPKMPFSGGFSKAEKWSRLGQDAPPNDDRMKKIRGQPDQSNTYPSLRSPNKRHRPGCSRGALCKERSIVRIEMEKKNRWFNTYLCQQGQTWIKPAYPGTHLYHIWSGIRRCSQSLGYRCQPQRQRHQQELCHPFLTGRRNGKLKSPVGHLSKRGIGRDGIPKKRVPLKSDLR